MKSIKLLLPIFIITGLIGCKREDQFLNAIPNNNLQVFKSLDDIQLIMQNQGYINRTGPGLGELCEDNHFAPDDQITATDTYDREVYLFAKTFTDPNATQGDFEAGYHQIFYANTALDNLPNIKYSPSQQGEYDKIRGEALYLRGTSFYRLLQVFAKPYDQSSSSSDLGIQLRLTSEPSAITPRSTVSESYSQAIADLKASVDLLPDTGSYTTLPTKNAAIAYLARVYLSMGDYSNAFIWADKALSINKKLTNYNDLTPTSYYFTSASTWPIPEIIYTSSAANYFLDNFSRCAADTSLYTHYDNNDLRKTLFFQSYNGYVRFKGSYNFKIFGSLFDGLANDEIYLIRAECNARSGNTTGAMADLNTLLANRYATGTFVPRTANNADDALQQIITERKKELIMRGCRWSDLRRLNKDPRFQTTIIHEYQGQTYTLPPNDPRYVFPIPQTEIDLSHIQQNAR